MGERRSYHRLPEKAKAQSPSLSYDMKSTSPLSILVAILVSFVVGEKAEAQWGLSPFRPLDQSWRTQERQLYRPNVHVVRPKGASRTLAAGAALTLEYSVMRGFVTHVEVRSGQKVIRTIPLPSPSRSGRVAFTPPSGLSNFKLWAWQGQPAYQSVHGESVKYSLRP